eukprot:scaffold79390_cov41-Prasinocladus_malaysianus.AAC.1
MPLLVMMYEGIVQGTCIIQFPTHKESKGIAHHVYIERNAHAKQVSSTMTMLRPRRWWMARVCTSILRRREGTT